MAVARLVECSDSKVWNDFVCHSPEATFFHRFDWAQILSRIYGYQICSLILESSGKMKGMLPLARVKSRLFGDRLVSMPFSDYGGIVVDNDVNADILWTEAEALTKKLRVDYLEVRMPSNSRIREYYQIHDTGYSYLVDLSPSEGEIWSKLESRTRSGIRRAQRRGVKSIEVEGKSELREYYALYQLTMREHGSPCHPYTFFEELWNAFSPAGLIKILLGCVNEKIIAGAVFFLNNGRIHYWSGATLEEARNMSAGNLIFWDIILQGKKMGCHSLDMGRTRPGTGVDFFKRGWGGKPIELNHLYYSPDHASINPPDPRRFRYRVMSLIWKRMPLSFTRIIGPWAIADIAL